MSDDDYRYRAVLATTAEAVFVLDKAGVIIDCNQNAEKLLGLSLEQIKGKRAAESRWRNLREDGSPLPNEELPAMVTLKTGEPQSNVIVGISKPGGTMTWLSVNAQLIPPEKREGDAAVVACIRDVTLQKKAFDELRTARNGLDEESSDTSELLSDWIAAKERIEATLKRQASQLARRSETAEALSRLTERFVGLADVDDSITSALADLADVCGANRAYVFLKSADGLRAIKSHEWCAPYFPPEIAVAQDMPLSRFNWTLEQLDRHRVVAVDDAAALPPEATGLRELLESQSAKSVLLAPVTVGGGVTGLVGFDKLEEPRSWNKDDRVLLEVSARIIGNAIERRRAEDAEIAARKQAETLRVAMSSLTADLALEQVLVQLLVHLERVVPFHCAALMLREGDTLELCALEGELPGEGDQDETLTEAMPLFKKVLASREPTIMTSDEVNGGADLSQVCILDDVGCWMGVPLIHRGQEVGLLSIASRKQHAYTTTESQLAKALADEAATAIHNARLFKKVQEMARTDALTGLYNRRQFFELARKEIKRARRHGHSLTLVMLDIDQFKRINDKYGHDMGDRVLERTAAVFESVVRGSDTLARYGGDEFVLILPETEPAGARCLAERLCAALAREKFNANDLTVTASLGVASFDLECADLDELLKRADRALYASKKAGRNQVSVWGEF